MPKTHAVEVLTSFCYQGDACPRTGGSVSSEKCNNLLACVAIIGSEEEKDSLRTTGCPYVYIQNEAAAERPADTETEHGGHNA